VTVPSQPAQAGGEGASVDGRRSGAWTPCLLTEPRGKRSWLLVWPAHAGRIGGDRERQRSSSRALRAAEKAAATKRRYGAALLSLNFKESVESTTEAGSPASTGLLPAWRVPQGGLCEGVERFCGCSCCGSVAEVGKRHLPCVVAVARKGGGGRAGQHGSAAPRDGGAGAIRAARVPGERALA
jgi:hypothetical protein